MFVTLMAQNFFSWRGGGGKDLGPPLKGLSHEIDFKNFDKNLQNLTYL